MITIDGTEYEGRAISYARVSSGKQVDGRGLGRQDDGPTRWCALNRYHLDTSFIDPGMSAFRGKNATLGKLARIIELAEAGTWQPGTVLIVESLDRLSRQEIDDAQTLFRRILATGLNILTLMDGQLWTLERWRTDLTARIISLVIMSRANEESETKSKRLKDVWENRREAARAGQGKATKASPEWLTVLDGEFQVVPEKLAIIERIKADRFLGLGKHAIFARLNADQVPAFRGPNGWYPSGVEKLVKSEALRGIYQPHNGKREVSGDPIEGYYPRVMSDQDWYRMQWTGAKAAPQHTGAVLNNLFSGLFHCRCGGGLVRENKGGGGAFLICSRARRGLCNDRIRHPLGMLETEMLTALSLFDVSALASKANPQAERIAAIEAAISGKTATIEEMAAGFGTNVPPAFFKRMQVMQAEVDAATVQLREAYRAARIVEANADRDAYAEFRAMVEATPTFETRKRIAGELRRLIQSGESEGTELLIQLRGIPEVLQIELQVVQGRLVEIRLVETNTGDFFSFTRAQVFDEPDFDPIGKFEEFIARRAA